MAQSFGGGGGGSDAPSRVDPYQPAGDLLFAPAHGAVENYRRELDLETALVTVEYDADGSHFRREYLADFPNLARIQRGSAGLV